MSSPEKNTYHDDDGSPWDVLKGLSFDEQDNQALATEERLSKKPLDIFVRKVFELNPQLKDATSSMLESYSAQNKRLPFLHITPDIIEYEDGEVVSTNNIENIKKNGFFAGDSNVGGFVSPGRHCSDVGKPASFDTEEAFLKSYIVLLQHYLHHAYRLNHRNSRMDGKAKSIKPAFMLVRGDLKVDHGTDYEDHFILRHGSSSNDIVGVMKIDDKIDLNDPNSVASSYSNLIKYLAGSLEKGEELI